MEFLRNNQLDIMLVMIGVCGIIVLMLITMKTLSKKRKTALVSLELSVMMMLVFDRFAYLYRGDTGAVGLVMTRVSNFFVFFFTIFMLHAMNIYLSDLLEKDGHMMKAPKSLIASEVLFVIGLVFLVVAQFTGLYYTFDEQNLYHRAPTYAISYVFTFSISTLQVITVLKNRDHIRKRVRIPLILFMIIPYVAAIVQIFFYGISFINLSVAGMAVVLYGFAIWDLTDAAENANHLRIKYLEESQKKMYALFEETAEALVSAIDAKDRYTHGHSARVAKYSARIAKLYGMSEEKVREIYLTALLHDVGKIGIPDAIINKEGRLTDEEYAIIKSHPEIGNRILSKIKDAPYLSVGAHYHHERYDGKGYPDHLRRNEIPMEARLISVADAYDTMTSRRSYRNPIPQTIAREEFVKGSGTQFDPEFAQIMLQLIDQDVDYSMKDNGDLMEFSQTKELKMTELGFAYSQGVRILEEPTTIRFRGVTNPGYEGPGGRPVLLLYDSEDKLVHTSGERGNTAEYTMYAQIHFDGTFEKEAARKIGVLEKTPIVPFDPDPNEESTREEFFEVEVVRCRDHIRLRMNDEHVKTEMMIVLPYTACFAYVAITGAHCLIDCIEVERSEEKIDPKSMEWIAEEVRFTGGPEGDIPNFQIDGYRLLSSKGIPVTDSLGFTFHTKSLPMAKLVWHCPFLVLYDSEDGEVYGEGYQEYALIRLDGESCPVNNVGTNQTMVTNSEGFGSWEEWKERNKEGTDGSITIKRKGNRVNTSTELSGLLVRTVTVVPDGTKRILATLTGDLVALTDIHVSH